MSRKIKRREAIKIGTQFVKDLEKEFGIKFIYWFDGSIATGKYVPGKSDIDLVVIPDESFDYGKILKRKIQMMEEYAEKYGRVFKKGRLISIIDPMLFLSKDLLLKYRACYHEVLVQAIEGNSLKRIKIDPLKIIAFEKKWQSLNIT